MSESTRNILIGLFMVTGLAVMGALMVMFGEAPDWLGGAETELVIRVDQIGGIDEGTPIYLNGIKVGRVVSLRFVNMRAPEEGVELVGRIKRPFAVPRGARAECIGPALGLGRGRVEIYAQGRGMPPVDDGGLIQGTNVNPLTQIIPESMFGTLEDTLAHVGNFAEALTPVAEDLHEMMRRIPIDETGQDGYGNLYTALERVNKALMEFDKLIADQRLTGGLVKSVENVERATADAKIAIADLRDTSANVKMDASRIAERVESIINNVDNVVTDAGRRLGPVLDGAAATTGNFQVITDRIKAGEGTIGKLLNDDRLYEGLVLAVERIRDWVDALRRITYRFEKQGRIGLDLGGLPAEKKIPG